MGIAKACTDVCPRDPTKFNVDDVRILKLAGGEINDSSVLKGFILIRDVEGEIKSVSNPKVAVYHQSINLINTETKGTVFVSNAEELLNYNKNEADRQEFVIKEIANLGAKVVICGTSLSELSRYYLEKYSLMIIHSTSKFELRRICQLTNSQALVTNGVPNLQELGVAKKFKLEKLVEKSVLSLNKIQKLVLWLLLYYGVLVFNSLMIWKEQLTRVSTHIKCYAKMLRQFQLEVLQKSKSLNS